MGLLRNLTVSLERDSAISSLLHMIFLLLVFVLVTFSCILLGHNPRRIPTSHAFFLTSHFLFKSLSSFNLLLVYPSTKSYLLQITTRRKIFLGHNPHRGRKSMISSLLRESKSDFAQTPLSCGASLEHYKTVNKSVRRFKKVPMCGLCPVCGLCPGIISCNGRTPAFSVHCLHAASK
jgi:hypothetical protein